MPAGSSPHTRGAHCEKRRIFYRHGIIPAYAGSTMLKFMPVRAIADHPRIRGEHSVPLAPPRAFPGSSPHTRGAPKGLLRTPGSSWIIPAYAGSTTSFPSLRNPLPDHPRIRGEHSTWGWHDVDRLGSSPHTRGARFDAVDPRGVHGIIPAYAGSTTFVSRHSPATTDHPRIRGEHTPLRHTLLEQSGSSPHTRGARPQ